MTGHGRKTKMVACGNAQEPKSRALWITEQNELPIKWYGVYEFTFGGFGWKNKKCY